MPNYAFKCENCDHNFDEMLNLSDRDIPLTKPCPECGTMIFRISGCPQMFCVECHCPWNWNTGLVEKGTIHNPHYYEFLNRGGVQRARNHADIPCGGLPDAYSMRNIVTNVFGNSTNSNFMRIHNCITHIQHHELRNHVVEDNIETNRELRVKYLINEISENEFKAALQQFEKKRQKTISFHNIYQMFVDVASDIFRQIEVEYRKSGSLRGSGNEIISRREELKSFINENIIILDNLIVYFNENLKKIGKMYKCVYSGISPEYMFINNLKTFNERKAIAEATPTA
jgi:putative FmdB family regulatory protein